MVASAVRQRKHREVTLTDSGLRFQVFTLKSPRRLETALRARLRGSRVLPFHPTATI
jgi:hypothetical protein